MNMKEIDYTKNTQLHIKVQNKPKEWRLGQAYFNYAYELYPKEVEELRGTEYDCFYADERIPIFLYALNMQLLKIVNVKDEKRVLNIEHDENGNLKD